MKKVKVISQSETGRNLTFKDTNSGRYMNIDQFCRAINAGNYPEYHIANINGIPTPRSNPDSNKNNNLE